MIILWNEAFPSPPFLLFLLELCKFLWTSLYLTFLQFLQFWSEEENPLPFGIDRRSYTSWKVIIYCGRRRFPLSSISFRAMQNCGSLHVNVSVTLTVLF